MYEAEIPAVRWGLHRYLTAACNGSITDIRDILHGFRLFYRVMNCREGQPAYPNILDEDGQLHYGSIKAFLEWAEEAHPELKNGSILLDLLEMEATEIG